MSLYPAIEPYECGFLDVGEEHSIYWETCGNPAGTPIVALHGGPGSGCSPGNRRLFNPGRYHAVLFDQRNSGRSRPFAGEPEVDLSANTTWHLVADIERLREHLGVERWVVWGGSWGSVLALAYATSHPDRVSAMVLVGVATGRHCELDWLFRGGLSVLFPAEWDRLRSLIPEARGGRELIEGYSRLLHDVDQEVRRKAAYEWCLWESATPNWPPASGLLPRFEDPEFALAFSRLVTHYVRHDQWIEADGLLPKVDALKRIPGILVNGRYDFQSPISNAWELHLAWTGSELVIVDNAGHTSGQGLSEALVAALDRFAGLRVNGS